MLTSTKKCVSCKTDLLLEDAMLLHWCTVVTSANEIAAVASLETVASLEKPLLCKNCTYTCDRCKLGGCSQCIKTECCDCSIQLCRKCSDVDDLMCDCFGKCYTCGTDVSRGSGWPCGECGIWNCRDCKKSDKNPCKECGPPPKSEPEKVEVKTTFKCKSCETVHPLEKSIRCEFCNINDESEAEEASVNDESETVASLEEASVDSWDGKIKHLFCKKCTRKCDACEERGCKECVEFVCCDCGYNMCYECRNNEVDCGCYGKCYSCRVDVNRGSEGWPCGECEKWYCGDCRRCDNPCKECGPEPESESEEESESREDNDNMKMI
jgi:hypothetical protein